MRRPGGTEVTINGSASTDPDGLADIEGFTWSARSVEAGASTVSRPGATWTTVVPEGATVFTLNVSDAHGGADSDAMRVTVDDSSGPVFGEIELATECLWPPNHAMALFELGADLVAPATDVCDAAPTVRIASVTSNQPEDGSGDGHTAPDVVFGEGAFCVRAERAGTSREPREYTVVLEAADHAGNVTETEVAIRVHHDRRDGQRCEIPDSVELVGDDDPRCTASIPPPPPEGAAASDAALQDDVPAHQPAPPSCAVGWSGGPPATGLGLFLAAAFAAAHRARRRRWVAGATALVILSAVASGCEAVDAEDVAALRACAAGVWLGPPHACRCSGSALDTSDCGETDCETRALLVLEDGVAIEGLVRTSKGGASLVGGPAGANRSEYTIDDRGRFVQQQGGKVTTMDVSCEGGSLTRERGPSFLRADPGVGAELSSAFRRTN